jgi:hypothetical protein
MRYELFVIWTNHATEHFEPILVMVTMAEKVFHVVRALLVVEIDDG